MPVRFATTSAPNTAYAADDVTNEVKRRAGQSKQEKNRERYYQKLHHDQTPVASLNCP